MSQTKLNATVIAAIAEYIEKQGGSKLIGLTKELAGKGHEIGESDIFDTDGEAVALKPELNGVLDFVAYTLPSKDDKPSKRRFFLVPFGSELEVEGDDEDGAAAGDGVLDSGDGEGNVIDESVIDGYFVTYGQGASRTIQEASDIGEATAKLFAARAAGNIASVFGAIPLELTYQAQLAPRQAMEVAEEADGDDEDEAPL